MSRIDEIRRWSRIQADMERTAAKNGISSGESENEKKLREDIDYLLSQLKDGGAASPMDITKLYNEFASRARLIAHDQRNDISQYAVYMDAIDEIFRGLATASTETSARCGECGHHGFVDRAGICRAFVKWNNDAGERGIDLCGCQCVFPASTEVAGEQSLVSSDYENGFETGCAFAVAAYEDNQGHLRFTFQGIDCCKFCKLVWPADGWTRWCKGPHELSLRDRTASATPVAQPDVCSQCSQPLIRDAAGDLFHAATGSYECGVAQPEAGAVNDSGPPTSEAAKAHGLRRIKRRHFYPSIPHTAGEPIVTTRDVGGYRIYETPGSTSIIPVIPIPEDPSTTTPATAAGEMGMFLAREIASHIEGTTPLSIGGPLLHQIAAIISRHMDGDNNGR
jgi:hypothetical protein